MAPHTPDDQRPFDVEADKRSRHDLANVIQGALLADAESLERLELIAQRVKLMQLRNARTTDDAH